MSDISRGQACDLILKDDLLREKHLWILVSEKENQIKQLDVTLDRMKSVDIKKIELTKATLVKEIAALRDELSGLVKDGEIVK